MDWIQGIQRAIDFVEANIGEEMDLEKVAKQAYSSSFHFPAVAQNLILKLLYFIHIRNMQPGGHHQRPLT